MRRPPQLGLVAAAEIPDAKGLACKAVELGAGIVAEIMGQAFNFLGCFALACSALPGSKR